MENFCKHIEGHLNAVNMEDEEDEEEAEGEGCSNVVVDGYVESMDQMMEECNPEVVGHRTLF